MPVAAHPVGASQPLWRSALAGRWWESRTFLTALVLIAAAPLFWPEVPPLVDVAGHIGRYRVQLDLQSSPELQRYFDFQWAVLANLGVDLLVIPLSKLFGLEPAVKLIVISIPPLTVASILWVAKEVHGRIPATALFAIPFVYSYPFNFGFVNFALSMALALSSFAVWLRLTRLGKLRLRTAVFLPTSCIIWLVHAFGWGALGLLAFSAETIRHRDTGNTWRASLMRAARDMVPLSIPIVMTLVWRSTSAGGVTIGFLNSPWKLLALFSAVRDRWLLWDSFAVAVALVLIGSAIFDRHLRFSRRLGVPAVALLGAFVVLPSMMLGSAFADMRLGPFIFILALAAIRTRSSNIQLESKLAAAAVAFVMLRLIGNSLSFAMADSEMQERLAALEKIHRGAAVLVLAANDCEGRWELPRHMHTGGFVVARRLGFANDQWQLPGAQLLRVRYSAAGPFQADPSSFVYSRSCVVKFAERKKPDAKRKVHTRTLDEALAQFPRDAFDYVWLVLPPDGHLSQRPGLVPVWRGRDSILYQVAQQKGL